MALFKSEADNLEELARRQDQIERLKAAVLQQNARRETAERDLAELRGRVEGQERLTSQLLESLAQERESHQRTQERLSTLVTQIVEMKREGFVPAPVATPGALEAMGLNLPDSVMVAIEQRSHGVPELERKLVKYALGSLREQGSDPEKVAQAILVGGTPPPEDDDDGLEEL